MSARAPMNVQTPTRSFDVLPARVRYLTAAFIISLTSMGALVWSNMDDDANAPATNPGPAASHLAPSAPLPHGAETFSGCLNDIECNGEPSHLPLGYWDPPIAPSVD